MPAKTTSSTTERISDDRQAGSYGSVKTDDHAMSMDERKPLSVVSKLCYGLSGIVTEMYIAVLGAYTNVFLVEVAQLPPLFGTSVVLGGRALDCVFNFIVGPLIDRTDTRWGKMKPWLLGAGLWLVPLYILFWYVPDVGKEGRLAWYILLSILLMFAKTAINISARVLVMFLSDDSQDRDSATAYRGLFMLVGIISGIAIHGQIVALYGHAQFGPCANHNVTNNTNSTDEHVSLELLETGYLISAGVISALSFACILAVVIGTTERKDISKSSGQQPAQSLSRKIKTVLTFRPNVFLMLIIFSVMITFAILLGASVLYVQYRVHLPGQIQNAMLVFVVSAVVSVPPMSKVVATFGKRIPFMCYQLCLIPSSLGLLFIPERSLALLFVVCIFLGISCSSGFFILWAMLNDVADDYDVQTGRRLDTLFFSIALSVNSLAVTLGQGMTTIALEIGGYKTGACVQPDSVGTSLGILASVFPAALAFFSVLLIWGYPITDDRRKEITAELEKRKAERDQNENREGTVQTGGGVLHPGYENNTSRTH